MIDDTESFVFTSQGWIAPRVEGRVDVYVFAYGRDYTAAVRALYAVSGLPPVIPRWALGNWWSRYHAYSAEEYVELFDRFDSEGVPFSVAVLDMDWHRVGSMPEKYGTGWTGYSWEPALFPDPEAFLAELHRRGLRVSLNVHPHEGVQPFEDAYRAMCDAMGVDASSDLRIPFDVTDPLFAEAYLDVLHHPIEDQGVDFWWIDWQQGNVSQVKNIDPLWVLNYLHFVDSGRGGRRGLTSLDMRGRAVIATRSVSPATPSSPGTRCASSQSSPRRPRTLATAGGATTSGATCTVYATTD